MSKGTFDQFLDALGDRESAGHGGYHAVTGKGANRHLGRWQFGVQALEDLGYMDASGKWTGKDGIKSDADFLTGPNAEKAQKNAIKKWMDRIREEINQDDDAAYEEDTIHGHKITISGMLAGAHLVGHVGLKKFLNSGGDVDPQDGNKTHMVVPGTQYIITRAPRRPSAWGRACGGRAGGGGASPAVQ